jgi:hypothetical protein
MAIRPGQVTAKAYLLQTNALANLLAHSKAFRYQSFKKKI